MPWGSAEGRGRLGDVTLPAPLSTPSHLTLQWLQQVLNFRRMNPVALTSFNVQTQDCSEGFLSEILFVRARYVNKDEDGGEAGKECRLALKFLPQEPAKRQLVLDQKVALREIGAYRFLSSEGMETLCSQHGLQLPVPQVLFTEASPDAVTLVLEDLREDYTVICPKEGLSLTLVKRMLKAIGVVHALGRAYIMKHSVESLLQHLPVTLDGDDFLDDYVTSGLAHVASLHDSDSMKKVLISLVPKAGRLGVVPAAVGGVTDTLLHGDYWAGQVMVGRREEQKVKILDWQFARIGNPFVDVVTLLVMSAAPDVLNHHLEEAVESYWRSYVTTLSACSVPLAGDQLGGLTAALKAVETLWHLGLRMLLSSVQTHLAHHRITFNRFSRVLDFFSQQGVLTNILRESSEKC